MVVSTKTPLGCRPRDTASGNDAQGLLSAPSFNAAAIAVGEAHLDVSVTLIPRRATTIAQTRRTRRGIYRRVGPGMLTFAQAG